MTAVWSLEEARRLTGVGLMALCLSVSVVALGQMFQPGWGSGYLVPVCGLVAVESYLTHRQTRPAIGASRPMLRLRLAELVALFLGLQLINDAVEPHAPLVGGWPHVDQQTISFAVPALLSWLAGGRVAAEFARLGAPPVQDLGVVVEEVPPGRNLARLFFVGGAGLVALAALTQPRVADALKLPHPTHPGPLLNVLAYFLLGAALLADVQLATLRQRWRQRGLRVQTEMSASWARYALAFVAVAALLALLLPTSNAIGLLDLARGVWQPLLDVLSSLWLHLIRLFSTPTPPQRPPRGFGRLRPPPHLPSPPSHPAASRGRPAQPSPWVGILKLAGFWLLALTAATYVVHVIRQRLSGRRPGRPRIAGLTAALSRLWAALRTLFQRSLEVPGLQVPARAALRLGNALPLPPISRCPRLGRLSPRRQIISYYLGALQQAGRRGFARRSSQTPREYAAVLAPKLGEAGPDLEALSDAFVEARYSAHPITSEQIGPIRRSWTRVRGALRKVAKTENFRLRHNGGNSGRVKAR